MTMGICAFSAFVAAASAIAGDVGAQGYAQAVNPTDQIFGWMKAMVALMTIGGIAFGGWNMLLQSKFKKMDEHDEKLKSVEAAKMELDAMRREVLALHRRHDEFDRRYNDDRVALVKEFATKGEITILEDKLVQELRAVRDSIDKLRDKMDDKKA